MKTPIAGDEPDFHHLPATPAHILFDSSVATSRSALGAATDRQLLFVDPAFDIHMKIAECGSHKEIYGQVIPRLQADRDIRVMLIAREEQLQEITTTDAFGEFRFDQVPAGSVCIEILTRSHHIVTSFDA